MQTSDLASQLTSIRSSPTRGRRAEHQKTTSSRPCAPSIQTSGRE